MQSKPLTAESIIELLELEPLESEGGFYRRTFLSSDTLDNQKPAGSAIYFLITKESVSSMHRLASPEMWYFHSGDPIELLLLGKGLNGLSILGNDLAAGQRPQKLIPGGVWQGAIIAPGHEEHGYSLLSCSMSPAFDWAEFESTDEDLLMKEFPEWGAAIRRRTQSKIDSG